MGLVVVSVCALAGLSGLGFISVGGYLSLRELFAPWKSGLIVGSVLAGLSLVGILITRFLIHGRNPRQSTNTSAEDVPINSIASVGEAIGSGLREGLHERGVRQIDLVIAAMVSGTVLGASPALRDRLFHSKKNISHGASSNPQHSRSQR